jgi:outer membrane receptor protein involved in Fe transport
MPLLRYIRGVRYLFTVLLLVCVAAAASAQAVLSGVVKDESGAVVSGASVVVRTASGVERQTVTGPEGRFMIEAPGPGTLIVRAGGFAESQQSVSGGAEVEIVLKAPTLFESVTVTPGRTEQRLGDVPASVTVVDKEFIRQSPAFVADDVLRNVPTFSLFRRTSSLSSHPTAQGVSLRGIGPSGVSRTLVLIDNVPFNDPFGGWVYWTRVPLDNVDRIEVVEGPSSSVYGNYGMGGVINIVSTRARRQTAEIKPQFGNRSSRKADFFASDVWGRLGVAVDGSFFDTDGFPIVASAERGPIDNNAAVNFKNVNVKADYTPSSSLNVFARVGHFREERDNGKISTFEPVAEEANHTRWTSVNGGARVLLPDASDLQATAFVDDEKFFSNFLAVPAPPASNPIPRSVGRFTLNQNVPTKSVGGMVQWGKALGLRNYFSAGTDLRWVDGDSNEDALDAQRGQTVTLHRVSGGTQRSTGLFVQDIITPTDKLNITLASRVDHWRNYDAHNLETNLPAGTPAAGNRPELAERSDTVASPRAAALYKFTDRVSAWGGVSSGFRAPTLNELYRQFRVGTVLTLANENLEPERLVGGELGVNVAATRDLTVRSVWFDNRVKNPVSNVTIATTPAQITQQRQNVGRTRVRGVQTDAEYRLGNVWRVSGGYLFNDAKVRENEKNPALVGKYLPQVPKHRGSFRIAYADPRIITVSFGAQLFGKQYDDDLNVRGVPASGCAVGSTSCVNPGLPKYGVVDLLVSRDIGRNLDVFFAVQNIGDTEYFVGTNPTTIGSPRLVNGGVRVRFSRQ